MYIYIYINLFKVDEDIAYLMLMRPPPMLLQYGTHYYVGIGTSSAAF